MTFVLREYQVSIIDQTRAYLREHQSVLVQSPTGSGKTALAAKMFGTAAQRGIPSFFFVHRQELIDQTINTFSLVGIPHGVIANGYTANPLQPVQICSIDTIKHRLDRLPFIPKFIGWDECHHIAAAGWTLVKDAFNQAKHVGFSATPERLDGKGLNAHFTAIVKGPTVRWLMTNIDPATGLTYLCQYRAFAPSTPDMSNVHTKMGDYAKGEVVDIMDTPTITGDAIKEYMRLAPHRRAVAFCVSVEHSQHVAHQFRENGIPAYHLDGGTPKLERRQAIQAFREGKIEVLCNVDLFGEGFDLPAIEVSIMLRPTKSLALYLQQVGRAFRQKPQKALILDHAGNIMRHGLPDEERDWTLAGRDKKKKREDEAEVKTRMCPKCFATHPPAPVCPECGWVYEIISREVEHVAGDLQELDLDRIRFNKKMENNEALKGVTSDEEAIRKLTALGVQRGYKHASLWAEKFYAAKKGKRQWVEN